MYTSESIKKGHTNMRIDIIRHLRDSKNLTPIVVDAPHVYLWELKYYRVQSSQFNTKFIVFECRTLFSKDNEIRSKQLEDINVVKIITDIIEWLKAQPNQNKMLQSQKELLAHLTIPNAVTTLTTMPPKNNSFCPNMLLNIQLAAWLTSRSPNNIYMDLVWNYLDEWEEISNDTELWKCNTPQWGY